MLPEFLQSSYERYKTDTNTFAAWLLETASKCGYYPPGLEVAHSAVKKGKRESKRNDSNAEPFQYSATTKDLQKFAGVIANSALPVPASILAIAKRAIKLRKAVTSWFLGQGDSAGNDRHAHFVTVLEQICGDLEWMSKQPSKSDAKPTPQTLESDRDDPHGIRFLNKFVVLTIEEPQEATRSQQAPAPVESKKIVKVNVVEEEESDDAELFLGQLYFKNLCLLQDLNNIRTFISITWAEYRDKKIDLMNTSVVTDSALTLAQDLVREVEME